MSNFWQFRNVSDTEGELILYGPIASRKPWWSDSGDDGIYANQFTKDLKALGNITSLTVRLNSGGGDVFAANAIYAQLKAHAANVTVIIEGVAASAATIIMAAGDTVKAPSNATVMVHDPLAGLMGYYNKKDLEKVGNVLETVKASIVNGYISKTGRTADELAALMDKETWMTAAEAMAEGFVDEILYDVSVEASFTTDNRFMVVNSVLHDLSGFETRPTLGAAPVFKPPVKPVAAAPAPVPAPPIANKKESEEKLDIKNIDELKQHFPSLCNELITAAATSERNRIKAIDDIAPTVPKDLVAKAKYDEPMTAEALAFQALKADAANGTKFVNERQEELNNAGDVKAEDTKDDKTAEAAKEAQVVDKIAASMNAKRNKEGNR